jgi:hypothetical protein
MKKRLYQVTATITYTMCVAADNEDEALELALETPMTSSDWDNDEGEWQVEETYEDEV